MNISEFDFKGQTINMMYDGGNLAYTFETGGKTYGYKTKLEDKKVMTVASAAFALLQNAVETIEAVNNLPSDDN